METLGSFGTPNRDSKLLFFVVWLLLPLLSLSSCSTSADRNPERAGLSHLMNRYLEQFGPRDFSEDRMEVDVLEDLGTVTLGDASVRIIYFSFSWSGSETGWRHQTNKLLIFESPDRFIGDIYLNDSLVRAQCKLRASVLRVTFDTGQSGEVAFASGLFPEPTGGSSMGTFQPARSRRVQ